ncbi:helix-turn-helix domain-containing protein [Eggerthella sinensis]|uniref:helix-turn-helix domain-containing protein n=1 Tax=Eggerthella sinensis TaxID=242230 RepID=UPI001D07743D|nr:helix-turn-helix transcriptional regulator [Eggerthella sinensis]MCB7036810.1 helix-turn-helix domain-containing protein [Eggerthella sinensis]
MEAQERKARLGARVRELREAQGLSQQKFALMIGTGQSYLSDIEAGQINVGYDLLCRMAEGLGVKVGDLADEA